MELVIAPFPHVEEGGGRQSPEPLHLIFDALPNIDTPIVGYLDPAEAGQAPFFEGSFQDITILFSKDSLPRVETVLPKSGVVSPVIVSHHAHPVLNTSQIQPEVAIEGGLPAPQPVELLGLEEASVLLGLGGVEDFTEAGKLSVHKIARFGVGIAF